MLVKHQQNIFTTEVILTVCLVLQHPIMTWKNTDLSHSTIMNTEIYFFLLGYIREEKNPQARSRRRQPFNALFSPKRNQQES